MFEYKDPETIRYDHFSDGLFISNMEALDSLTVEGIWSFDTTFNVLKDKEVKLITVSFKDAKRRKAYLGAVATLKAPESTYTCICEIFYKTTKCNKRKIHINFINQNDPFLLVSLFFYNYF